MTRTCKTTGDIGMTAANTKPMFTKTTDKNYNSRVVFDTKYKFNQTAFRRRPVFGDT